MKQALNPVGRFLRQLQKTIGLILAVVAITLVVTTLISMVLTSLDGGYLPSVGFLKTSGVRVYWDVAHQNETSEISWGTIYPGSSKNVTIYVQSVSNVETVFTLDAVNWTFLNSDNTTVWGPSNSTDFLHKNNDFMNLNWTYDYAPVNPGETIPTNLTLSVRGSDDFIQFLVDKRVKEFSLIIFINANETR
jgi:hypothetical protein